jgi:hypothetical protein
VAATGPRNGNRDHGLLNLAEAPVKGAFDDKAQETARAVRLAEGRAGQNPLKLCAHSLCFHGGSILSFT